MAINCVVGKFDNAAHLAGPAAPTFPCLFQCNSLPISGTPDDNIIPSRDASVRRLAIVSATDNLVTFVDTSSASVITQTAINGLFWGLPGEIGCFASSVGNFYIISADGVAVYSADGAAITTVTLPTGMFPGGLTNLVYSPEQDLIYGMAFNGDTSTRHIFTIDPATNLSTDVFDVGSASQGRLGYSPNRLYILYGNFQIQAYTLPSLTLENTLSDFTLNSNAEIEYAASIDRLFISVNTFSTPVSFIQVDPSTMTIEKTYTTASVTGLIQWIKYNPVKNAIEAVGGSSLVQVDLATQTIACEDSVSDLGPGGLAVDYSNGTTMFLDEFSFAPSNLLFFSICS